MMIQAAVAALPPRAGACPQTGGLSLLPRSHQENYQKLRLTHQISKLVKI